MWHKLGRIFNPNGTPNWMNSHAQLPTPLRRAPFVYRIYFATRGKGEPRSQIGWIEVDLRQPDRILATSETPALSCGDLGCFDDCGVDPSSIVMLDDRILLYYIGWKCQSSTKLSLIAGLAASNDDGFTFKRVSRAPLLQQTDREPFNIMTAPFAMRDGDIWKLWYVSGEGWVTPEIPKYNIKYAESADGERWNNKGFVCLELLDNETALAKPCILKEDGIYKMWYSYKRDNKPYRMGYAESTDGLHWTRKDNHEQASLTVSSSGWDSEMICYPQVVSEQGVKYMFYNGNNYGGEGIGLAVFKQ